MRNRLLVAFILVIGGIRSVAGQTIRTVRLTTADDVGIAAAYYPVGAESAPALVLLHSFAQSRDEWNAFATLLQRNGIAALTIDFRGHGESTRRITASGPQLVDYHNFTARDFNDMLLDVNAAMDWLGDQPGIDTHRLGVIGASVGANTALRYALFNEDLAALVLLSPGIVYKGVRTDDVIGKLGRTPLRIAVSRYDAFAFESCRRLMEIRRAAGQNSNPKELIICTGNLHGADMLKGVKDLPAVLLSWLRQTLLGITPEPIEPASPPAPAPQPAPTTKPAKPAK